jgi:hypothetical protein
VPHNLRRKSKGPFAVVSYRHSSSSVPQADYVFNRPDEIADTRRPFIGHCQLITHGLMSRASAKAGTLVPTTKA